MEPTFRERYCAHHRIPLEAFQEHLLPRDLHLPARVLRGMRALPPEHFFPDREFLRNLVRLRTRRQYWPEASEFLSVAANRGFARRFLRLRLSTERVRRCMEECWNAIPSPPLATSSRRHTSVAR